MGAAVSIIIMVFGYLLNPVWFHFQQHGFQAKLGYAVSDFFQFIGGLFLLGSVFGIAHALRRPIHTRNLLRSIGWGFGSYYGLMIIFEVLWYEPWTMHEYIDTVGHQSHFYNSYQLDAMYGTPLLIIMILTSLLAYLVVFGATTWSRKLLQK